MDTKPEHTVGTKNRIVIRAQWGFGIHFKVGRFPVRIPLMCLAGLWETTILQDSW